MSSLPTSTGTGTGDNISDQLREFWDEARLADKVSFTFDEMSAVFYFRLKRLRKWGQIEFSEYLSLFVIELLQSIQLGGKEALTVDALYKISDAASYKIRRATIANFRHEDLGQELVDQTTPPPQQELELRDEVQNFKNHLSRMSAADLLLLDLLLSDASHEAIATLLAIDVGAVRARKSRLLRRIRKDFR